MKKTKPPAAKPPPLIGIRFCSFCNKTEIDALLLIESPVNTQRPHNPAYICNECVGVCTEVIRERTGETNAQRLWKAWSACSDADREKFSATISPTPPPKPDPDFIDCPFVPTPPPPAPPDPHPSREWQHGSHIDSMPTQPPLAENPAPVTLEEESDDDEEPADWWKELTAKAKAR